MDMESDMGDMDRVLLRIFRRTINPHPPLKNIFPEGAAREGKAPKGLAEKI